MTKPLYDRAETELINSIQRKHYDHEMKTLLHLGVTSPVSHNELRTKSGLTTLNPFLDDNLTLRAGGRLEKSDCLTFSEKYPIILPKNDDHVRRLIQYEHEQLNHASVPHTLHSLRSRFAISGGRTTVQQIIRSCVPCQKAVGGSLDLSPRLALSASHRSRGR